MTTAQDFGTSDVFHNAAQQRFELRVGEALCVLDYRRFPGKLVIYHTEVPPPLERRGFAARMTRAALDFARSENLQVEPRCPYTAAFMQKNPEFTDLLAPR
ncbi:MAG TPA: GNAT family N-acetyltransferase [Candidatus Acidoferrum sp.]|nr:GNAT family N-acetyltransferase [Candidatus Acidoferrum sp.]